jgi:hypothetical protein
MAPPSQHNNDAYQTGVSVEVQHESHNLILKLSNNILANPTVQKSIQQITKFSQPLITRFDDNLVKLTTGLNKYVSQEKVRSQIAIANHWIARELGTYSDTALVFIEKRLVLLLGFLGQKSEPVDAEKATRQEKVQAIISKLLLLSQFSIKKVEEVFKQLQATKPYVTADKYLHINEKIDKSVYLTMLGYKLVKEDILHPGFNYIKVTSDKTKAQVTVVLEGLNVESLKKRYTALHGKYEVLRKCVVILKDETVKLVFDKKALAELGENGKTEITRLYQELRTVHKVKEVGLEYYAKILKKANETYNTAQVAIQNQSAQEEAH